MNYLGNANAPRVGLCLQTGGDVHPITHHIPAAEKHIPQMDADAVEQLLVRIAALVGFPQFSLNF